MASHLQKAAVFAVLCVSLASCSWQKGAETAAPAVAAQGTTPGAGRSVAGGGTGVGTGGRRGAGGPVPVVTAKVQSKSVPVTIPAAATAEPLQNGSIRAQTTRQL